MFGPEMYSPGRAAFEVDERCPRCGERSDPHSIETLDARDDYSPWPFWICTGCGMPYRKRVGETIPQSYSDWWTLCLYIEGKE